MSQNIVLPDPVTTGGKPLMDALNERRSGREFADSAMSDQLISNLLWAAYGINRPETGKRTAPSARNMQEFDIYVVMKSGAYLWKSDSNNLELIQSGDLRRDMGKQDFAGEASLVLVFVADYSTMGDMELSKKDMYSAVDCGYISQNVYLFAASENLNTVVLGSIDREHIVSVLGLSESQKVIFTQPVGFPAGE
ncbi:hypothetical protein SDC9_44237 [bioreactor metagenome]|uniref:Nitroreductase domain-containing protein n=1 Tax=bioreactor metagenome TaxID=1076179 RepID=A0A644W2T3_9ZZZZ